MNYSWSSSSGSSAMVWMSCRACVNSLTAISAVCRATSSAMRAIVRRSWINLHQRTAPRVSLKFLKLLQLFDHHAATVLFSHYRSSMINMAVSSASLLMLSIMGVHRAVWVSASSSSMFACESGRDCSGDQGVCGWDWCCEYGGEFACGHVSFAWASSSESTSSRMRSDRALPAEDTTMLEDWSYNSKCHHMILWGMVFITVLGFVPLNLVW